MKVEGQCHCGAIQYRAELEPENVGICHCNDCQSLSATAFRTIGMVKPGKFEIIEGSPKLYIKIAESGNRRQQAFCDRCGSGLYATSDDDGPKTHNIRMGTVKQRDQFQPQFQLWCRSAQSWLVDLNTPDKRDRQ